MKVDKFGQCLYEEKDILELIYQEKTEYLDKIFCTEDVKLTNIKQVNPSIYEMGVEDFDKICQNEWLMPDEYKNLDIITWLFAQIPSRDQYKDRLFDELKEFEQRNMIDLLRWLKYLIDTARANNIVWGVGRGSSVASYVLYLIGVHRIDPIKYNLDYKDFLR